MSETKSEGPTIAVKLFIDKERSRVLFAESDKDFVDVLFGFLTLPLGTFVRLFGKQSQVGCLDELYKSVEDLSAEYFQTKACKAMLLNPFNDAAKHCRQLKVRVDDSNQTAVYVCKDANCCANGDSGVTFVSGSICKCGKVMEYIGEWPQDDGISSAAGGSDSGVFVKGCFKFIVTDDLQIAPASTSFMMSIFDKFGVRDPGNLEQKILQLNAAKITSLLKISLTSKQALTVYYFDAPTPNDAYIYVLPEGLYSEQEVDVDHKLNNMKIKVLQKKNNTSLLYAEVGEDFVDLLFGLLSIPLGSIIKAYGKWSSNGCVENIYRRIDGNAKGFVDIERQILLVSPNVASFFGCSTTNVLLQVEEADPKQKSITGCFKCFKIAGFSCYDRCSEQKSTWNGRNYIYSFKNCSVSSKYVSLCEVNPKLPYAGSHKGEGYVKQGVQNFMVTDDLHVRPLSSTSTLQAVTESKIQAKELVEKEITLTKIQVMELLRAALVTRNTLSSVLLPPKKRKLHRHINSSFY